MTSVPRPSGSFASVSGAIGSPRPARILVVESSSFERRLLTVVLSGKGHDVSAVEGGEEALGLASTTAFDLAVVDRVLAGADGLEVCRRLSELPEPMRPVTLLCSVGYRRESEGHAAARECGAAAFSPKGPGLKSLLRTIDELLTSLDDPSAGRREGRE